MRVRRPLIATLGLTALVLTACVAEPPPLASPPASVSVQGGQQESAKAELHTLDSVDIADLGTITDGDNGSLVYAVIPQVTGYDVLNDRLREIAQAAEEPLSGPHAPHAPRRGYVNVSWQVLGTGADIVGFLVSSVVSPGASAAVAEDSVWYDAAARRLLTWRDLVAESAQEQVIDQILADLRRTVEFPDLDGASAILHTGDPVVGFGEDGRLVLGFDEYEVAAGADGAPRLGVVLADADLTPVGLRARQAALRPSALAPAPVPDPAPAPAPKPARKPVDCRKKACVAITFDDGPAAGTTKRLLGILSRAKAPATFFVLGTQAQAFPKLLSRMAADGHQIGNHTWSHRDLTKLGRGAARKQLLRTERAIEKATGAVPTVLRPPYGARDRKVDALARDLGYAEVLWSIDTRDWSNHDPKKIVAAAKKAKPGAIILMHDIHADTVDAVPRVIKALRKKGLTLVTVSELVRAQKPGKRYYGSY